MNKEKKCILDKVAIVDKEKFNELLDKQVEDSINKTMSIINHTVNNFYIEFCRLSKEERDNSTIDELLIKHFGRR